MNYQGKNYVKVKEDKSVWSWPGYKVTCRSIRKQKKVSWDVYTDSLLVLHHCMNQPGRDFAQNSLLGMPLDFSLSVLTGNGTKYSRCLGLHLSPVLSIIMPWQIMALVLDTTYGQRYYIAEIELIWETEQNWWETGSRICMRRHKVA